MSIIPKQKTHKHALLTHITRNNNNKHNTTTELSDTWDFRDVTDKKYIVYHRISVYGAQLYLDVTKTCVNGQRKLFFADILLYIVGIFSEFKISITDVIEILVNNLCI